MTKDCCCFSFDVVGGWVGCAFVCRQRDSISVLKDYVPLCRIIVAEWRPPTHATSHASSTAHTIVGKVGGWMVQFGACCCVFV